MAYKKYGQVARAAKANRAKGMSGSAAWKSAWTKVKGRTVKKPTSRTSIQTRNASAGNRSLKGKVWVNGEPYTKAQASKLQKPKRVYVSNKSRKTKSGMRVFTYSPSEKAFAKKHGIKL